MGFVLEPRGPFSLERAARVLLGYPVPTAVWDGVRLSVAFCLDRTWEPVGATLEQRGDALHVDAPAHARAAIRRIFSLDLDGDAIREVARRDPVVRRLVERMPGLRPVLFGSPWEAAVWAILTQRVQMKQAARRMRELADEHGALVRTGGHALRAFPGPERMLQVRQIRGVLAEKIDWLHGCAHAALRGRLDTERLRAMPTQVALRELRQLPGIGPFSAELILLRGVGVPDLFPTAAARAQHFVERAYGPGADVERLAENWRPWRSWVAFLLRNAAED